MHKYIMSVMFFSNNILINMNIFKYGYNEINVQGVLDLLTSYGFSS